MAAFTPGPWRAFASDDDVAGVETADGRFAIADCEVIGVDMPPDDECGANALLIAAAPNLYTACGALLEAIESGSENHMRLVAAAARAAIAKAEGK